VPRSRPVGALAGRPGCVLAGPSLVERAEHAALGEATRGGGAPGRGAGAAGREGARGGGAASRPAHHGRDRPRGLQGALRCRPAVRERPARRSPRGRGAPRRARRRGGRPVAGADLVRTGRGGRPGRDLRPLAAELTSPVQPIVLATVLAAPVLPVAMCSAGLALLLIGLWATRNETPQARGLDTIVALGPLCFAIPLAVFGALHLFGPPFLRDIVPPYMPGRSFWVYSVGCALIAASLSIA